MVRTLPCSHIDPLCTKEIFNILLIKSSIPVLIFRSLKITITEVDMLYHMHLSEESGLSSCALSMTRTESWVLVWLLTSAKTLSQYDSGISCMK